MSSILKALKKVEQERASQRDGAVNITFDVIKGGDRPVRRLSPVVIALVVGACLLVAATFVWWRTTGAVDPVMTVREISAPVEVVLPTERPKEIPAPVVSIDPLPSTKVAMDAPLTVEVVIPIERPKEIPVAVVSINPLPNPKVVKDAPISVVSPVPATLATTEANPTRTPVPSEVIPQSTVPQTTVTNIEPSPLPTTDSVEMLPVVILSQPEFEPDVVIPVVPPGRFVLTDIIYHTSPENRLAVINDFPVMEGTMIEDATVIEILSDRVKLDISGEVIEVFRP